MWTLSAVLGGSQLSVRFRNVNDWSCSVHIWSSGDCASWDLSAFHPWHSVTRTFRKMNCSGLWGQDWIDTALLHVVMHRYKAQQFNIRFREVTLAWIHSLDASINTTYQYRSCRILLQLILPILMPNCFFTQQPWKSVFMLTVYYEHTRSSPPRLLWCIYTTSAHSHEDCTLVIARILQIDNNKWITLNLLSAFDDTLTAL